MNRSDHLNIADSLQQSLHQWEQIAGDPSVAGEIIWGIIVHTVSALDPEHETQPPDRFGNPHPAPNTNRTFNAAAARIMRRVDLRRQPRPIDFAACLANGQQLLHNHFYHGSLPALEMPNITAISRAYAARLLQTARESTTPAPQP